MHRPVLWIFSLWLSVAVISPAGAVAVKSWSASTGDQFAGGTLHGTAVDEEGRVRLAPPLETMWGPAEGIVWAVRAILLGSVVIHIVGVVQLYFRNRAARPADFPAKRIGRSWESRLMMVSGLLLLAFIVFHILQFTTLTIEATPLEKGALYANVYNAFQEWYFVAIYLAALILVGMHLRHGIWSVCQTLGLDNPERNNGIRMGTNVLAVVIVVGFALVPILFYTGALGEPPPEELTASTTTFGGGSG